MNYDHVEVAQSVGDAISIGVVLGTLAQILPPIAALLTIIWTGIRIYESKTFGRLVGRKADD